MVVRTMRTCTACKKLKLIDDFYAGKYECKPCTTLRGARYRKLHADEQAATRRRYRQAHPEETKELAYRWRYADPERYRLTHRVHQRVRNAIRAGRLTRPMACEECGTTNAPIEAAHADYAQPLDVRWLCRSCHRAWDKTQPKGGCAR